MDDVEGRRFHGNADRRLLGFGSTFFVSIADDDGSHARARPGTLCLRRSLGSSLGGSFLFGCGGRIFTIFTITLTIMILLMFVSSIMLHKYENMPCLMLNADVMLLLDVYAGGGFTASTGHP